MRLLLPTLLASLAGLASTSASALQLSDLPAGATFTVTSLQDAPDADPGDGICFAEDVSVCTLRAAIMEANASDAGVRYDVVIAVEGEFELLSSDLVDDDGAGTEGGGAASGDLDIASNVFIQGLKYTEGEDAVQTVIQSALLGRTLDIHQSPSWLYTVGLKDLTLKGGGSSAGSVVRNYGNLELDDVAITAGGAIETALFHQGGTLIVNGGGFAGVARAIEVDGGSVDISGGAVFSALSSRDVEGGSAVLLRRGTLRIDDASFDGNESKNYGGVIRVMDGTAILKNATFSGNSSASGGAVYSAGTLVVKEGVTFSENSAEKLGGAIFSEAGLTVVEDSSFQGNSASQCGGAVYVSGDTTANYSRVQMLGNIAAVNLAADYTSVFGGAMCIDSRDDLHPVTIQDSVFISNSATANEELGQAAVGGAIYAQDFTHIKRSVFAQNSSHRGGAIYSLGAGNSAINSTFYLNKSTEAAGGIFHSSSDEFAVSFSTFLHNQSVEGGAVHLQADGGAISLQGVLLQGNGDLSGEKVDGAYGDGFCLGEVISLGGNLGADESCSLSLASDQQGVALEQLQFANNADGLGVVALDEEKHALAIAAVAESNCPSFDQRANFRGAGDCDVGAWERSGSVYSVPEVQFDFAKGLAAESSSDYGIGISLAPEVLTGEVVTAEVRVIDLGSATEGEDFTAQDSKTFIWSGGSDLNQTFSISLMDDYVKEVAHELGDYERVAFLLAGVTGLAKVGANDWFELSISEADDLASGEFSLASAEYEALEQIIDDSADTEASGEADSDDGSVDIDILRNNGSEGAVTLRYATEALTAVSDSDYESQSGEVTFADGETVKTVSINFINDSKVEADETFNFVIRPEASMEAYTSMGSPKVATLTIIDDDTAPAELEVDDDETRSDLIKRSASGSMAVWGLGFLLGLGLLRRRRVYKRLSLA